MAIDESNGPGFNNPQLDAWLRERAAQRLQAVVGNCFRRVESERVVQRYRAVVEVHLANVMPRWLSTRRRLCPPKEAGVARD